MSIARRVLVVIGLVLWCIAGYLFITGSLFLAGGFVVLGALCLVIAASGGWAEFFDGLTNWLYFGR